MNSIPFYTPSQMSLEILTHMFVSKKGHLIFDRILVDLKRRIGKASNQHYLILGPRGIGKSHLLNNLYYAVKENPALNTQWIPLKFSEGEYAVVSIRNLSDRILKEILKEFSGESNTLEDEIKAFEKNTASNRNNEEVFKLTMAYITDLSRKLKKRFIVIIENFNMHLKTINSYEEKSLRSVLMNETSLLFIASAPTLHPYLKDLANPQKALYNLFDVHYLNEFSIEECRELLVHRCQVDGNRQLCRIIEEEEDKLKLIYRFTGGNPRLILLFYQLTISPEGLIEIEKPFAQLLDQLTPYFHSITENLSAQQRKILITLAQDNENLTPAEVGKKINLPTNQVTAQIQKLVSEGFLNIVPKEGQKRGTLYELSKRIYRFWYQYRTGGSGKLFAGLMDFISAWFSQDTLKSLKAKRYKKSSQEGLIETGGFKETFKSLERAIEGNPLPGAYDMKGSLLFLSNQFPMARQCYDRAIELNPGYVNAYVNKGVVLTFSGKYTEALEVYEEALARWSGLSDVYYNKALTSIYTRNYEQAIQYCREAKNREPGDFKVYYLMSICQLKLKRKAEAMFYLEKGLDLILEQRNKILQKFLETYIYFTLKAGELDFSKTAVETMEKKIESADREFLKKLNLKFLAYFKLLTNLLITGDKDILDRQPFEIRQTLKEMLSYFSDGKSDSNALLEMMILIVPYCFKDFLSCLYIPMDKKKEDLLRGLLILNQKVLQKEMESGDNITVLETRQLKENLTRQDFIDIESDLRSLVIPAKYRDWILEFHSRMDIRHLDPNARVYNVPLSDVYIPIETTYSAYEPGEELAMQGGEPRGDVKKKKDERGGKEPQMIDIRKLLGRQECILLQGAAGMGKTTLIKHLTYTIIQGQAPVSLNGFLPVVVFLKDLWPIYEKIRTSTPADFPLLLKSYLENKVTALTWEEVRCFLEQDRALFLLDGLDEIPEHLRPELVEIINAFWLKNKNNRFLLTGRPQGMDDSVKKNFGRFLQEIQPLNDKMIKEFIYKWFQVISGLSPAVAEVTAKQMISDINVNEYVKVFTQNPLFLTAVCVLYMDNRQLPEQRVELYQRIMENLLYRRIRQGIDPQMASQVDKYLKLLAFRMMTKTLTTIDVEETKELLTQSFSTGNNELFSPNKNQVEALFKEIESRFGLLKLVREREIEFVHLSFQEFLAARYISYMDMDYSQFLEKSWWEETLLLYIGLVNQESIDKANNKANNIVQEILNRSPQDMKILHRLWLLGARALRDIQEYKREAAVTALAREKLVTIIHSKFFQKKHLEAGEILGVLGDPRIKPPPLVRVEPGEFIMGSNEIQNEQPIHKVYLDEFFIGKYPVTNEEYKAFIEDDGYEKEEFWSPEGWQWKEKENISEPSHWYERKWNGPNFPVVGVSWYEADAYARWMSRNTKENYTLPTEAQWEKAARGSSGLIYPWGNEFDKNLCNSRECGLARTSPVGIFPGGESHYGCMDMAGNVWEWCADWYGEDYYKESPKKEPPGPLKGTTRVFRGGCWFNNARLCRGASRFWFPQRYRQNTMSFRLVKLTRQ